VLNSPFDIRFDPELRLVTVIASRYQKLGSFRKENISVTLVTLGAV